MVAESASKARKFEQRGQLLPRERVARLLDRGTPFLELCTLAGLGMHDDDGKKTVMGGGSHRRHRRGRRQALLVIGQRQRIKGGTVPPMGLKKALRAAGDRAREQAAADPPGRERRRQPDVPERDVRRGRPQLRQPGAPVGRRHPAGRGRARLVHRRRRLPAGPATTWCWCATRSSIFLAGPPLVKAAIGEDATDEELGGAQTARRGHRPGRVPGRERRRTPSRSRAS